MTDRPGSRGTAGNTALSQSVRKGKRDEQLRKQREALLDEALKESFRASDPPSIAWPYIRTGGT